MDIFRRSLFTGLDSGPQTAAADFFFAYCFSVILLPEFSRDGNSAPGSFLYFRAIGSLRFIDLAIIALIVSHVAALACFRRKVIYFPRALAVPGLAFLACIVTGICYGSLRGGTNFFFDWRALALGLGLYLVWAVWIRTASDLNLAIRIFAIYMAVRIVILYALHLAGYRETLAGVRIPTFDGPYDFGHRLHRAALSQLSQSSGKRQKLVSAGGGRGGLRDGLTVFSPHLLG